MFYKLDIFKINIIQTKILYENLKKGIISKENV